MQKKADIAPANLVPIDPTRLGRVDVEPRGAFPAGYVGTWRLTLTVGKYGIDDGGAILIARRQVSDAPDWQCTNPGALGYCTATTTGSASLRLTYDARHWIRPWRGGLVVGVYDGSLAPGDQVTIVLGDTSGGSPGIMLQSYAERPLRLQVLVDAFGGREYYAIPDVSTFDVVPGKPAYIEVVLPSRTQPGASVPVRLRVSDRWFNVVDDLAETVEVFSDVPVPGLPLRTMVETGVQQVGTIVPVKPGVYRLGVRMGSLEGSSNPLVVDAEMEPLFWADLHGQSEETVGSGTVAQYLAFARDRGLVDATSWQGNDFQITDAVWDEVRARTREYYTPGRFVTFLGYEWSGLTPAGGDHNILYLDDRAPIHRSSHWQIHDGSDASSDRYPVSALWKELRGRGDALAIPHVGGRYADLAQSDPALCPLIEIHSHHGTFEWMIADAFANDLVVGFSAASDDHTGRPGFTGPTLSTPADFASFDVFGGLTAIIAPELTREAIWQAIRSRHCYATTGARILMSVRAGESGMGDVVPVLPGPLQVKISGTAPLLDVQVFRGLEIVYRHPFAGDTESDWVRCEWSGVRVKSRRKKARWEGAISLDEGSFAEILPYAFDRLEDAATLVSPNRVAIHSCTSGDPDGVFLRLSENARRLQLRVGPVDAEVDVADLTPLPVAFPAGGINLEMRVGRATPVGRPVDVAFEWTDPAPPSGPCVYWVRVLQMDGHMAWSSPIYMRPEHHRGSYVD